MALAINRITAGMVTAPVAVVIGREEKGISELAKRRCDYLILIPMHDKISPLNASFAVAPAMYKAFHQRDRLIPITKPVEQLSGMFNLF